MKERRSFFGIQLPQAPEKWEPKRSMGYEKLTPAEQWTADGFSVLEQKIDFAIDACLTAIGLFVFLAKILGVCILLALAIEGPRILQKGLEWVGISQSSPNQR